MHFDEQECHLFPLMGAAGNPASVTCVDKLPSVSSVNEQSPAPAEEVPTAVECLPCVSSVIEQSPAPAEEVPTAVECLPCVSSVIEQSPAPVEEVPTAVECLPCVSSVIEQSPAPAEEVPQTPSSLSCSKFYSRPKKRDIHVIQKVKTGTSVTETNCRRSQRNTCKPSRYQ